MAIVIQRREYRQHRATVMVEQPDIVYRGDTEPTVRTRNVERAEQVPGTSLTTAAMCPARTSALVLSFSALTGRARRIHYDKSYAAEVEAVPALVARGVFPALSDGVHASGRSTDT